MGKIPNTLIKLKHLSTESGSETFSNAMGDFAIFNLKADGRPYDLSIYPISYQPLEVQNTYLSLRENYPLDLMLKTG
ncbi:MAG: carboxypeptidase-like regulatory domain-containing protein [Flavobacteriales bacterium AspAUS03]